MKNRCVKDILILCVDGLSGIKESINVAFPNTEYQRCLVHQVRNTLKYVANKDKKEFAADLKTIYHAPSEELGHSRMLEVTTSGKATIRMLWNLGLIIGTSYVLYLSFQLMLERQFILQMQ